RYERPQKGRFRQFHQLDAEIVAAPDPSADVELIAFGQHLLEELGVAGNVTLQLNTLGDPDSRAAWQAELLSYFEAHRNGLSEDSLNRLTTNPLRILDSKNEGDRKIVADAPVIDDYLSAEAQDFFGAVKDGLGAAGVGHSRNARLVRGLDYYRHTAFEFVTDALGAQGTVMAGGRYDGLIGAMGGPETSAVGWAAGIERLSMLVDAPAPETIDVAFLPLDENARQRGMRLVAALRKGGSVAVETFASGKMQKRMQRASASGARLAIIIGADELADGAMQVKDLVSGEQVKIPQGEAGFIGGYLAELRLMGLTGMAGENGRTAPDFPGWRTRNLGGQAL
ncbi:MAG: histidine--tRNA ligase, partial [Pacificimonas sp.]